MRTFHAGILTIDTRVYLCYYDTNPRYQPVLKPCMLKGE